MIAGSGERVAWAHVDGSYAEQIAAPRAKLVPVPDGVSSEVAAAALLQGMTAHYLACDSYPVGEGDWVLVHAAAGGVGLLLTQIVKSRGGRVIATTSTGEKAELARGAGADEVIGYDGFAERAREITGGEGVKAVYDGVGKTTFLDGLKAIAPTGRMILYGAASGQPDPLPMSALAPAGSLYVQRPTLHDVHAHARAARAARPRPVRADRLRGARRPDRRPLPARARAPGARGPRGAQDDRKAVADPLRRG